MNIGFDMDETLTNSEKFIKDLCLQYIQKNNLPVKMCNPNAPSASDMFDWDFETFSKFWQEYGYKYEEGVPARDEAVEVLNWLKQHGHNVFVVTSRFTFNTYERSKEWLIKNKIPFDGLFVNVKDKVQHCLKNNITLFVDDSLNVYNEMQKNNIKALFIDGYTNRTIIDVLKYIVWKK